MEHLPRDLVLWVLLRRSTGFFPQPTLNPLDSVRVRLVSSLGGLTQRKPLFLQVLPKTALTDRPQLAPQPVVYGRESSQKTGAGSLVKKQLAEIKGFPDGTALFCIFS